MNEILNFSNFSQFPMYEKERFQNVLVCLFWVMATWKLAPDPIKIGKVIN